MKKRYIHLIVSKIGIDNEPKQIYVDIEIDSVEESEPAMTYGKDCSVVKQIILPIIAEFAKKGIRANYTSTGIHCSYTQTNYIGTVKEVINKILK